MNRFSNSLHLAMLGFCCSSPLSVRQQNNPKMFERLDANNDGKLTKDEFPEKARNRFEVMDADKNGSVSQAEFTAYREKQNAPRTNNAQQERPARAAEPTHANVAYGDHKKQAFDIWLAKSKDGKPTPLVIYIHGGGFRGGDKKVGGQPVQDYLDAGNLVCLDELSAERCGALSAS